eukprot:1160064_1
MTHKMLFCGYIRETEYTLHQQIIPTSITELCIQYYRTDIVLIALKKKGNCLNNIHLKKLSDLNLCSTRLNLIHIGQTQHSYVSRVFGAGICFARGIPLPNFIVDKIPTKPKTNEFDVVFQCGGNKSDNGWGSLDTCDFLCFPSDS